jgi:bifunctional non-homologous end joining protein LigD
MAADSPDRYTARSPRRRSIVTLRNDRTATAVASYSLRSRARAPVAMPLSWTEVTPKLDPLRFTILTVPEIVASRADPWAILSPCRQRLRHAFTARLAAA